MKWTSVDRRSYTEKSKKPQVIGIHPTNDQTNNTRAHYYIKKCKLRREQAATRNAFVILK